MLDFQVVQTPFRFGLAEGVDPRQAPPGTLTTAENVEWLKSGCLQKRRGTATISKTVLGGSDLAAATRIFARGNELCLIDGSNLYSYASSASTWTTVGPVPTVGLTQAPLIDPVLGVQVSDTAVSGNFVVTVLLNGDPTNNTTSSVYATVTDLSTGALLMPMTLVTATAANYARVLIIGSEAIVVSGRGNSATIIAHKINLSTYAITGPTSLRTDKDVVTGVTDWDARVIGGTSLFVLAYYNNAGSLGLYSFNASLSVQASQTTVVASLLYLSVEATSGEKLYVVYSDSAAVVRGFVADSSTMVFGSGFTVEDVVASGGNSVKTVGVCRADSTNAVVVYTRGTLIGGITVHSMASKTVSSAGTVSSTRRRNTFGVYQVSVPFALNGNCYVFGTTASGLSAAAPAAVPFTGNSCGLLQVYPVSTADGSATSLTHPYVACADTLLGAIPAVFCGQGRFTVVSSTKCVGTLPFLADAPRSGAIWRCGLRTVTLTTGYDAPLDLWRAVSRGASAFISCGTLSTYDGGDVFDYGFYYAPQFFSQTTSAAGGVVLAGNYLYATYGEYRSANLLFRGPTVVGNSLTTSGATSSNTLTFVRINVGNKNKQGVERFSSAIPIFRTVVNGTVLQRLTEEPTANLSPLTYSSISQAFTDTKGDASIDNFTTPLASRPALYTTGGILDDCPPPANVTQFTHVDRLFVLASDLLTWWFSKSFQDDLGVAPGFHPSFRIAFAETQTAGASMDDKAIFFSASGIAYMPGVGPGPNGQNSDFFAPTKIQTDVGCTNARSVVSMPDGIMFLSDRGIYLLTRGLEPVWIGRAIKDTLASFPAVTSAVLVAKRNQVRFTCNDSATSPTAGCTLVYDYVEKQWSTFRHGQGVAGASGLAYADACMWNGAWCFVTPGGQVYVESDSTYLDGSTWVPITLETAWQSAAGPLTFQSVRTFALHGTSYTDHDLTVRVGFDSDSSYPQVATFAAQSSVTTVGVEECNVTIGTRRKCQTIRFKVTDATPTTGTIGTGRGPAFDMMAIEVGLKRGLAATPAAKRA